MGEALSGPGRGGGGFGILDVGGFGGVMGLVNRG